MTPVAAAAPRPHEHLRPALLAIASAVGPYSSGEGSPLLYGQFGRPRERDGRQCCEGAP